MKKIIIASKNPVKINAALSGFLKMFPDEQFETEAVFFSSGVSAQPRSDRECLQGALNRANNAKEMVPLADFWVGFEGGIEEKQDEMEAFAWAVVIGKNKRLGKGKTGIFFLPQKIAELVKQGKELGEADDIVFGRVNSKQEYGAIGLLTDNIIDRTKFYSDAMVLALIPFRNEALY